MESEGSIQNNAEGKENTSRSEKSNKRWEAVEAKIHEAWRETENNLW